MLENGNMFDLIDHNVCMKSNMSNAGGDLCVCDNCGYSDVVMSSVKRNDGVSALIAAEGESTTTM